MGVVLVLFLVMNMALNLNAIPFDSSRRNAENKDKFLNIVNEELTLMPSTTCQGSKLSASWKEYCYTPDETDMQLRPCPILGSEPSADFYNKHCILSYSFFTVKSWNKDVFISSDSVGQSLNQLFSNLPREKCGHGPSDYCNRTMSICYRAINHDGICQPAERICTLGSSYYPHCSEIGQVYLLKKALFRRSDEFFKDISVRRNTVPGNPPGPGNPAGPGSPDGPDNPKDPQSTNKPISNNDKIIYGLTIAAIVVFCAIAGIAIFGGVFYYRRQKKREKDPSSNESSDSKQHDIVISSPYASKHASACPDLKDNAKY